MLKPTSTVKSFEDYASPVFIPFIKGQLQNVKRLDAVFDEFIPNSLKATTRSKRGKGVRRRVQSLTLVPANGKEFLRVDANKREMFRFLAEHIPLVDFGHYKEVIITKGQQVLCSPSSCGTQGLALYNHEEVDTRMLVHVASAAQAGY